MLTIDERMKRPFSYSWIWDVNVLHRSRIVVDFDVVDFEIDGGIRIVQR